MPLAELNSFHEAMSILVEEYGISILTESRLEGMMADLLGGEYAFYPVMRRAVQSRIGQRIIELSCQNFDYELALDNLKHSFQQENFLRPQAACYLVDSFAYALGLIPELGDSLMKGTDEDYKNEPLFAAYEDGEFCGYTDENHERCGFGILKKEDGSYYAGEWKLGMRMGFGIGFSTSREKYAGQWCINLQNGIGTQQQQDGTIYTGQWKNGKKDGYGTIYYPNGECLSAFFCNGELSDTQGIWCLRDHTIVQGRMTLNGPTDLCFHTLKDGTIVDEYWNNGKLKE